MGFTVVVELDGCFSV